MTASYAYHPGSGNVVEARKEENYGTEDLHGMIKNLEPQMENESWSKYDLGQILKMWCRAWRACFDHLWTVLEGFVSQFWQFFRSFWNQLDMSTASSHQETDGQRRHLLWRVWSQMRSPIAWVEVGDAQLTGPEIVREYKQRRLSKSSIVYKLHVIDKSAKADKET
ncbi:hypothetical protein Tco_1148996 [Tanacetum coccineum]